MYARTPTRPKPRTSLPKRWPAPIAGWVSNRALSEPRSIEGPGAAVLDNFFPRSTGVALRRGKELYATLEDTDLDVTAMFTYRNGLVEQFFVANDTTIYDLSAVPFAEDSELGAGGGNTLGDDLGNSFGWFSTTGLSVAEGYTGGQWSVVQFATTGGIYLVGVNGADTGFIYDGVDFFPNVAGGVTQVNYDGLTDDFLVGEVVTGGTSGATGTILRQNAATATTGNLWLSDVTGTFVDDDVLTGATEGAADAIGGSAIAAPGMDFGALTSADMDFVWSYKNRLWFVQKDSLDVWYLATDSIGGTATVFPMGGVFSNGGKLLFGARWSLESGGDGGLSDQNIFVTSQGEVAIYQGISPDDVATWNLVGVYRIGSPLGKKAYIRGGGDLAIATTVGLVPLSKAISLDQTALNVASLSYKIADAWTDAIQMRGDANWQAMIWPEAKLAAIAPPDLIGSSAPVMFVSNTQTGAWARYTGWQALCMETYRGQLYFGSPGGKVFLANVGGLDDGAPYSGAVVPLFDTMDAPASSKIGKMARATTRSSTRLTDKLTMLTDYNEALPAAPDATPLPASNTWGSGVWGTSVWGSETPTVIGNAWRSVGGIGYSLAPCYQVTSGAVAAIDVELIDMDSLHTTTEMVG